jgi:hypothetical protein
MTKPTASPNPIEKLLQERAQYVSWLTRLNSSSDAMPGVPESVRSRVRSDYERRLDAVMAELKKHQTALEEQVEQYTARRSELLARETEYKEQLSEAEVRHLVGEYDDNKWSGIRAELNKMLLTVREQLGQTSTEIERLNEVLGTIRAPVSPEPAAGPLPPAPPAQPSVVQPSVASSAPRQAVTASPASPPAAPASAPAEPARVAEPEGVKAGAAPPAPPAAAEIPFRPPSPPTPKPQPKVVTPKKEEAPGRTLWFPSGKPAEGGTPGAKMDELAFLKSVTEAGVTPTPQPAPAAKPRVSGGFARAEPGSPPAAEPPKPIPTPGREPAPSGQKTLKCGECGTLNRPTEWYCERCGAELAAL